MGSMNVFDFTSQERDLENKEKRTKKAKRREEKREEKRRKREEKRVVHCISIFNRSLSL